MPGKRKFISQKKITLGLSGRPNKGIHLFYDEAKINLFSSDGMKNVKRTIREFLHLD